MAKPKVLFLDLETLPNLNEGLKVWNQLSDFPGRTLKGDISTIICFGYKWLGENKTHCRSLWSFKEWKKDVNNDLPLVRFAHSVIKEADVLVSQNGKSFDIKLLNTRIAYYRSRGHTDLSILPNIPHVDIKRVVKQHLYLFSNRLGHMGKFLNQGDKMKHTGWQLWVDVHGRDEKAMRKMELYCKQDVSLLEKIFKQVQGIAKDMPNLSLLSDERPACPKCGENKLNKDRKRVYRSKIVQTYICSSCGSYSQDNKNLRKPL